MDSSNFITFLHSGDLGDIISGLAAIKELCDTKHKKAILYLDTTGGMTCNSKQLNDIISMQSHGKGQKFNDAAYEFIRPLIAAQSYIEDVKKWTPDIISGDAIDYNLNKFRYAFCDKAVAQQTNQNLMYLHQVACGLEFKWNGPWLECEKKDFPKRTVIARSCRCQSAHAFFCVYEQLIGEKAYFIGTDLEYAAFCESIKFSPERFIVKDALDAAILLNSAEQIIANSSLFFWIAVGLGKSLIHELPIDIPTTYFKDCPNIKYIQGMHFLK